MLLSKDLDLYRSTLRAKYFDCQSRFLSGTLAANIAYTSYPRSGNTFLRKYLENITGVATGSDQWFKMNLNVALQVAGFKGEGHVTDTCWINKSHFPYRGVMDKPYQSEVILVAVRNPLDVFVSFFMMTATNTHTCTIEESLTGEIVKPYWDKWFESEVEMWVTWHEYWLDKIQNGKVPVYFFRFEDLISGPEDVLKDIFRMVLGATNIDETIVHQRIKDTISGGKNFLYKPRAAG